MADDPDDILAQPEDGGTTGDVAVIGETSRASAVSIQTLQGIYNELTGKSEEVGKSYSKPIRVKFADLEQLHLKVSQACEQYNVVSSNLSVTVYYVDDTRDQFSSFERFGLHNAGSASPVESVLLKYNFLILLPKTRQPQSYTVSIRLASRVAVAKRMDREFYGTPPAIFRLMGNRTAVVEIQYIDYMVARNFLNIIDEWFKGIPLAVESRALQWLQVRSHVIPQIARFATVLIVGLIVIAALPTYVPANTTDLSLFGRFAAYGFLVVYTARGLAWWSAGLIEQALDRWSEVSYLQLTKGDEIEIAKAERRNGFAIGKGILGFLLTVTVSIVTKIIANILTA